MPALYITEQGCTLHISQGRLLVEKGPRVLLGVPLHEVESVLVFGHVQVTTAALSALLAQGREVYYLSCSGRFKGRAVPGEAKNVGRRLRQFQRHGDKDFRLKLARGIVRGKIANQRAVLHRLARNGHAAMLHAALRGLKRQLVSANGSRDEAVLRGVEGAAAALYFGALRHTLPSDWGFVGRTRPATDRVNALLNLGYTLAGCEIMAALSACGFDPYIGFFHAEKHGRPALALDLLEEFRAPFVDRLALSALNLRILSDSDFEIESGQCRLRPVALRRYLEVYEKAVSASFTDARDDSCVSFRRLFLAQSRRLMHAVEATDGEEAAYRPYRHK
jgi:CRISPR-associated protein Cas1